MFPSHFIINVSNRSMYRYLFASRKFTTQLLFTSRGASLSPLGGCVANYSSHHRQKIGSSLPLYQNNYLKRAVLLGLSLYTGLKCYGLFKKNNVVHASATGSLQLEPEADVIDELPAYKSVRSITSSKDDTGLKLTLYQHQTCPFCCKVRAYLDYKGFSYDVVEVNSLTRKELKWSKYRKVPLLCIGTDDGVVVLKDSAAIISMLETYLIDRSQTFKQIAQYYPMLESDKRGLFGRKRYECTNHYFIMYGDKYSEQSKEALKVERRWRKWTDDVLLHTISPNVYRTMSEALAAFHWYSDHGDWESVFTNWERKMIIYCGAVVMYIIAKLVKSKYSLKSDVRESLYDACNEWTKALGKKAYMGGDKPSLADLAVYGVLSSMSGCEAFSDAMNNTKISTWYRRIEQAVKGKQGDMKR